ncbi:MAG: F0F1 ATP synthase subunit gamma [Gammaproteobacteria bacterium]
MAGTKEIRTQIRSVQSNQKITRAMEMVAASKVRRVQARMQASRPYVDRMRRVIGHLAVVHPEFRHPFLLPREQVRGVGFLVIGTDRGLCGGLNINLLRAVWNEARPLEKGGIAVRFAALGQKAVTGLHRLNAELVATATHLGDRPGSEVIVGPLHALLEDYRVGRIDRLVVAYNYFLNTMTQKSTLETLLPLPEKKDPELFDHWDYLYEPDSVDLLDTVLMRYLEAETYQALLENIASEQAARMVAMRNASDNAGTLIDTLKLAYNKARQASITQEIAEIVGGAAAV